MTRSEHLQWAKDRAIVILRKGDVAGAIASLLSDMGKHPELENHKALHIMTIMLIGGGLDDLAEAECFILGFNFAQESKMDKNVKLVVVSGDQIFVEGGVFLGHISSSKKMDMSDRTYNVDIDGEIVAQQLVDSFNSHPVLVEALEKIKGMTDCGDDCGSTCYCGEESCIDKLKTIAINALSSVKEGKR